MARVGEQCGVARDGRASVLRYVSAGVLLLGAWVAGAAAALTYPLPPADTDVIGEIRIIEADRSDTLLDLGRSYGIGYEEMRRANPDVDVWLPGEGTEIVIPTRFVLPDAPREGLVINLAEMRLYYYPPADEDGRRTVETYPISVGRMDWTTPLGETRIVAKEENPYWYPPESIREEARAEGRELPKAVPPGPQNPLGRHKMRLDIPGGAYLIHGTNNPLGIGMRVTHGCVRMFPEDVESLFERLPVNTAVRIVNQPVKAGWVAGTLFVETHPILPPEAEELTAPVQPPALQTAVEALAGVVLRGSARVDHERLGQAVRAASGMPVAVSREASSSFAATSPVLAGSGDPLE
ncbi:hypothetical protein DEM34_16945 [Spiribacter halobius]|uniref:L,D-TPase catalytic domain-containing protein n=2 Tax=Sediminicurvatus halobius TaxID=2182432 RepID=A0A2U2MWW6_9GAMM|nr:hypothetical protein DEM34_16945 [Spiribacter halobius]